MSPERHREIERLYDIVRACAPGDRSSILNSVCKGDEALRREVECMVTERAPSDFMELPAIGIVAETLAADQSGSLAGSALGPYRQLAIIGRGAMGEVYAATDSRLDRTVAIKKLPALFTKDPQRIARLAREARLLASVNHPNIAAVYEFEQADDFCYLVMEFVPGQTLAERLKGSPLQLKEALRIGFEIAQALEAAHEKGIVHRDLKPANIKITPDGTVKVLDFGLAKPVPDQSADPDARHANAITPHTTVEGAIVGTPAYMSPEQAEGERIDRRTDVWAFGCVLFETLTGEAVFRAGTTAGSLAAVLTAEPDWERLPATTPEGIRRLLRRCLQKDRKERLQWIGDASIEIAEAQKGREPPLVKPRRVGHPWTLSAIGMLLLAGVFTGARLLTLRSPVAPVARAAVALPPGELTASDLRFPAVALSPDGSRLVSVSRPANTAALTQLYVRRLDQFDFVPIQGTDGAIDPFFSPDGQWIGFYSKGKIRKVSVSGGPPLVICNSASLAGASWGADNQIVFSAETRLYKVSAAGGEPVEITMPDLTSGEADYNWPDFLPGGKAVLFSIQRSGRSADDAQIASYSLLSGQRRILLNGGSFPRYLPTGHLTFVRAGTLFAVPFDTENLVVQGTPTPLVDGIMYQGTGSVLGLGVAQVAFSKSGVLFYLAGGVFGGKSLLNRVVWVDRNGAVDPMPLPARDYSWPRLSPDGQKIALLIGGADDGSSPHSDIWIYELARKTLTRLTSEADHGWPVWTPDGKRVTFTSSKDGPQNIFWKLADGSGPEEPLITGQHQQQIPRSWSADGKELIYNDVDPTTGRDLWVLPLHGHGKPRPLLRTSADEMNGVLSPDGHWLAYVSNQSGQFEVYLQSFPVSTAVLPISSEGGFAPVWSRDGKELFYRNGDRMMVVDVTISHSTIRTGKPRMLFESSRYVRLSATPNYDVSADGKRLLMIQAQEQSGTTRQAKIVFNWFDDVRTRVPRAR